MTDSLADPQRWNRYGYGRNNPLRFTDVEGKCVYPGADCVQYLIGVGKSVVNVVPDTATLINMAVNVLIAPITDFRFGEAARLRATNNHQKMGMLAGEIASLLLPLTEASGPTKAARFFSRQPLSLLDEMVLEAAMRGEGVKIIDSLSDPRFKGMEKWSYQVRSQSGKLSEVHYVRDPVTGELVDFKFVHHADQ
jgi:hypothetical protein